MPSGQEAHDVARRVRVVVSGRVQGVFYRTTCAERARALGLGGWVRNLVDGDVEAAFEGPPQRVEAMVEWCSKGPSQAHVASVSVVEEPLSGEHEFRVRG